MAHTLIIAEAGVNHNGSIQIAKKLVDAAVEAGVDIIKFQTFKADKLVSKDAKKAEYQKRNIGDGNDSQYDMLKKLELSHEDHQTLIAYCKEKGIRFWSTAFDFDSIDYLHSLGLNLWKIPSGEITNYPFIRKIAAEYEAYFKDVPEIEFFVDSPDTFSNYWLNAVILKDKKAQIDFLTQTNDNGVMTRPIWELMNRLPMFEKCENDGLRNTIFFADRVVNIPSSVRLSDLPNK